MLCPYRALQPQGDITRYSIIENISIEASLSITWIEINFCPIMTVQESQSAKD